ncbi:MAG TPA: FAD-binding oxidoreductase [Candidatus Dormibacteraeota bacterium]|nr:FAD-binding oxidoreductase [Candidatus Dormibacteraeota bacterium]
MVVNKTAVEKPATAEELARRLHGAAEAGLAVFPVGGGKALEMGDPPAREGIELHTTALDRVLEHSQADMVVSVEAGITLEALQSQLGKSGQFLPLDPFSSPGHTVGGLLATGWSGPLRLRYGSARDFLIGIRVALPDGRLASAGGRVVKNVSGYDLMKLHYGALGTLGVIVAASFKVFPRPLHDITVESMPGSMDEAWTAAEQALGMAMAPAAVELFSNGRVLARFLGSPDATKRMVADLGWMEVDGSAWEQHAKSAPLSWARIATPRHQLRSILDRLGPDAQWWASPGTGIANWAVSGGADDIRTVRAAAVAVGGSVVILAGPSEFRHEAGAWGTPPATLHMMRRLRTAFDPNQVINPGRFVV